MSALPEMAHYYNFDRGISGPQCECQMCGDEIDEEDEGMCRRCEYGECDECGGVLDEYGDCDECGGNVHVGYRRCCGTTQRGTHCQIDSNSVDSHNRKIAQAAQRLYDGHNYCGFHAHQEGFGPYRPGPYRGTLVCGGCCDVWDEDELDDELLCEECAGQVEVECDECGDEFPRDTMSDGVCEDCIPMMARRRLQAAAAQRQTALAAQQQRAVADAAHKSGEVQFSHVRTREERDAEGYANAIDLDAEDPPAPKPAAAKPKAVAKKPAAKPAAATKKAAAAKPAAAKPKKTIAKAKPAVEPAAAEPRRSGRSRGAAPNKLDL